MGMMSIGRSNVRRITLKNADGSVAGTVSISAPEKKKKKRLQYNFKEISSQILWAKTCGSAKQIAVRARVKAATLRMQRKVGEYDDKELDNAIVHAEQIARIAKKRMKQLQEEERAGKHSGETICEAELEEKDKDAGLTDMITPQDLDRSGEAVKECIRELEELLKQMEMSEDLEELSGITVQEDMDPADLELLKKKHRADELREITEADMKYLKTFFARLEKERREAAGGVSLEISGIEMPVPSAAEQAVIIEGGNFDTMA